jgi:hypothetical protein
MKNKKRLVYADEVEYLICGLDSLPWEEDVQTLVNSLTTVDAVPVDEIIFHHILIDENGIPEVMLQFGEKIMILRREDDPVDVAQVVRGHWIVSKHGLFRDVKCSVCGKDYACHYGMLQLQNFSYCPNCGAKMEANITI